MGESKIDGQTERAKEPVSVGRCVRELASERADKRPESLAAAAATASVAAATDDDVAASSPAPTAADIAATSKAAVGKPRKGTAAAKRKHAQRTHAIVRFCTQIAFFLLAPGLFSSALNGVKYLCSQVGALEVIEPTAFVASLVFVVGYTVVFGRFFCGYACAFGTMGDVLFALAAPLRRALRVPKLQGNPRLLSCLQAMKLVVLAAVCVLCFLGIWDVVAAWDPWAVFGKVTSGAGIAGIAKKGTAVLVAIMIMQALFERSFCRFLCPMGALFSLLPVLPFSVFNRQRAACGKKCNRCQDACPVDIHPDQGSFHSGECIACGRCAVGCPLGNVNLVFIPEPQEVGVERGNEQIGRGSAAARTDAATEQAEPTSGSALDEPVARRAGKRAARSKPLVKLKGSGVGWVAAKAVLLLALCWLAGLLRFAPSPAEILPFALPWL